MEIVEFPNYLIYPDGRVYNQKRKTNLKLRDDGHGHGRVILYKDGKGKNFQVHKLVGEYYIPNHDNKDYIIHINGVKTDNRVENLRWASRSELNDRMSKMKHNNTSGHSNITYHKRDKRWQYFRGKDGKCYTKNFVNKIDALCFKFIMILKLRDKSFVNYQKEKQRKYQLRKNFIKNNHREYLDEVNKKRNDDYYSNKDKQKQAVVRGWKNAGIRFFDDTFDKWYDTTHCESCGCELIKGKGMGKNKKVLDHDHFSGYLRNVVCHSCNVWRRGYDNKRMKLHLELYRYFHLI